MLTTHHCNMSSDFEVSELVFLITQYIGIGRESYDRPSCLGSETRREGFYGVYAGPINPGNYQYSSKSYDSPSEGDTYRK